MPCKWCEETVRVVPCKEVRKFKNKDSAEREIFRNEYLLMNHLPRGSANSGNFYAYCILQEYCPCKECIIKTICNESCPEYYDRIKMESLNVFTPWTDYSSNSGYEK